MSNAKNLTLMSIVQLILKLMNFDS